MNADSQFEGGNTAWGELLPGLFLLHQAPAPGYRHSRDQFRLHAALLLPGQDLPGEMGKLCALANIRARFVLSAVGSLTKMALGLADWKDTPSMEGPFEIVSLTGTTGPDGVHLHMAVSDEKRRYHRRTSGGGVHHLHHGRTRPWRGRRSGL